MLYGLTLIVLGLLAAPSLLLSKKPDAKELLDKLSAYQGWIGLVFCILGVWGMITYLLNIGSLSTAPIVWITYFAGETLQASLGFILGYGMINKLILSKNQGAENKGAELLTKLAPIQGKLGLFAVVLGIWMVVASIIF